MPWWAAGVLLTGVVQAVGVLGALFVEGHRLKHRQGRGRLRPVCPLNGDAVHSRRRCLQDQAAVEGQVLDALPVELHGGPCGCSLFQIGPAFTLNDTNREKHSHGEDDDADDHASRLHSV